MNCLWVMAELCNLLDFIFSHSYRLHTFIFKLTVRNLKQVCVGVGGHSPIHTHTPKIMFLFCWSLFLLFLVLILSLSFKFIQKSDSLLSASVGLPILSHARTHTRVQFTYTFQLTHWEIWNNSSCHCVQLSVYLSPIYSFTHTHTHTLCQCLLITDVLSYVSLVKHNWCHGICVPTALCGFGCNPKALQHKHYLVIRWGHASDNTQ